MFECCLYYQIETLFVKKVFIRVWILVRKQWRLKILFFLLSDFYKEITYLEKLNCTKNTIKIKPENIFKYNSKLKKLNTFTGDDVFFFGLFFGLFFIGLFSDDFLRCFSTFTISLSFFLCKKFFFFNSFFFLNNDSLLKRVLSRLSENFRWSRQFAASAPKKVTCFSVIAKIIS